MKNTLDLKNRRKFLKIMGAASVAAPIASLIACGGSGSSSDDSSSTTGSNTSSGTNSGTNTGSTTNTSSSSDIDASLWASGGTASMAATFPPTEDPFSSSTATMCTATAAYTLGPCYFTVDDYQQDISDGQDGIPMIVALKLVDQNCNAIAGADIEIWHCDTEGVYSGNTQGSPDSSSFSSGFCTGNANDALASKWFRGVQTTDSEGVVYFQSCFPGWYPSRTTHIHFKVVHNNVQSLVSQFCYDDDIANDIYLMNGDYTGQQKDTSNNNDNVFGSDFADYQFDVEQYEDGTMLAYKTIQLVT